jgi:hypothetical protein
MKKIWVALMAVAILSACKTSDKKSPAGPLTQEEKNKAATDTANFTTIEWLDAPHKPLGQLVKNQEIEITYRFRNTGTTNLVIENVSAGCGCTIPEKPERAFAPGEEGVIKAKFNGSGTGTISKNVTVIANTKPQKEHVLTFSGEIRE